MIRLNAIIKVNKNVIGTKHYQDNEKDIALEEAKLVIKAGEGELFVMLYHCANEHSPSDELVLSLNGVEQ